MINLTENDIKKNWKSEYKNTPLVSIKCMAYNHERYIADALDSFLMQKTDFPFEVVIHDDASTDNTASIIGEYQEKYPNIVKPIYEKENQSMKSNDEIIQIKYEYNRARYYKDTDPELYKYLSSGNTIKVRCVKVELETG